MLALHGPARRRQPRRLRLRLFSVAGRIVRGGRRLQLPLAARWPWSADITAAISRLQALASGQPDHRIPATRKVKPRARETPLTRRDSRATSHGGTLKARDSRRLKPPTQDYERSRSERRDRM
jgi:hypothetical protein